MASARPMVNHRGPEFRRLVLDVTARLKWFFRTENDVLTLTASGTGGLEAAVVNTLSPGDRVLAVSVGVFGDRFAAIARAYGADVVKLDFPWGKAADPDQIAARLAADPNIRTVLVTHNETSTGVTNDLTAISKIVKERDRLLLVDAVSSLGALPLPVDQLGCDVVVTGSQKSWMIPPGLAMISISRAGWEACARATMPRFYFDLASAKRSLEKGETPFTPAVSLFFALEESLRMMEEEGREAIAERHRRVGAQARDGVRDLGLALLADERVASNTVTAVKAPDGIETRELLRILREEHGVVLAGGQGRLADKIFRIGHLGWVTEADIDAALSALRVVLARMITATDNR
jgi:aspartate aminotransferase-like enzyme